MLKKQTRISMSLMLYKIVHESTKKIKINFRFAALAKLTTAKIRFMILLPFSALGILHC